MADAYFAHLSGDLAAARPHVEEALAIARVVGDLQALFYGLMMRGILYGADGDLAGTDAALNEGLALAREANFGRGVRMALVNLAVLARLTGDEDRAAVLLEEGRALSEAAGDGYTEGFYLTNLAHLAVQQGNWQRAVTQYRQALVRWRDLADVHNMAMALEGLAWPLAAQGHAERSARLFGAAERLREVVGMAILPHWVPDHERARLAAQASLGERAFALAWAKGRAMTATEAIAYGLAPMEGHRPEGMGPVRPRPGAAPPVLSARELEVARLVARGLTNRQIAEQLVLQTSTVGNHLQRIYARLELSGRAQLAAWVSEHDDASDRSA
jgi:non-specific serine/threonine protein kinase